MRSLLLLCLLGACSGDESAAIVAEQPASERSEPSTPSLPEAEEGSANETEGGSAGEAEATPAPSNDSTDSVDGVDEANANEANVDGDGANGSDDGSVRRVLPTPHAEASTEVGERINRASILRLTRALGLPAPLYVHGRPVVVPETARALVLISFLRRGDRRNPEDEMHTELWLLESSDGRLSRVAAAPMPHEPVPTYNEIAVGAEGLGSALSVKAQNIEDFDGDSDLEYQVVVELIDEVVCGQGALTHRHVLIYNLSDLSLALNIQTGESATVSNFRSTILWGDRNEDGHPDVDLRVRNCVEWGGDYPEISCAREQDTHVYYLWEEAGDRWVAAESAEGREPCDE
ncbi:MAG: hypothetical protein AAF645_08475 [Myxococcota bacterium]